VSKQNHFWVALGATCLISISAHQIVGAQRLPIPVAQPGKSPAGSDAGAITLPPRVGITTDTSISLADAIVQAVSNAPDVGIARVAVEQATDSIAAARGAWDPQLSIQSSLLRQELPVSSLIGGAASGKLTQQGLQFGPSLKGIHAASGTQYQVSFTSQRQTSDNQFITLNPQFPNQLSLSVTQPLFRGVRVDEARRQLDVSKQNATLSDSQFRQRVMDVALQTELAYWDLFFAEQNLQIQVQGLELAREQVASNQRLVDQGLAAPIDVLEAQTQVANLRRSVFGAQAALTRAENALKTLMLPDARSSLWASALHPTTSAVPDSVPASLQEAVTQARSSRPELAQAAIASAVQAIDSRFYSEQRKPQVDLVGTYSSAGLAGHLITSGTNPFTAGTQPLIDRINALSGLQGLAPLSGFGFGGGTVPAALTGGLGRSLSHLAGLDFPTFEVGVRIGLPWGNRTAEARYASSVAEGRRLRLRTDQLEMAVEAEVRNAMQGVESARAAREAALQARTLAEEQYASEQRRFEAGTSTVFLVVQRQTAMIATRTEHVRADVEVNRSIAQLQRATGQILAANQINVSAP
jgi:HAE1 family hydrophobic/amphiphilic exporter-1